MCKESMLEYVSSEGHLLEKTLKAENIGTDPQMSLQFVWCPWNMGRCTSTSGSWHLPTWLELSKEMQQQCKHSTCALRSHLFSNAFQTDFDLSYFCLRTRDPDEADFFFVPAYSICMFEGGFYPLEVLDVKYTEMVRELPYFKRHRGRDHIFTFGSGLSASVFRSWRREIPESIQLSPETWLFNDVVDMKEPCFNTFRDIAVPGYLHRHEILSLSQAAKPLKERSRLAVFLGRIDSSRGPHPSQGGPDVRAAIRRLKEKGRIFVAQNLSFPEMHAVMGSSKFCFVPKGKSAWSLRFFEALFANCIPVVLSDFWELPFESLMDLPAFVIKWPMESVGDTLMEYLESIPDSTLQEYMDLSKVWRCWYVYPPLLHEIAAKPPDELYNVCPELDRENAFEAQMG